MRKYHRINNERFHFSPATAINKLKLDAIRKKGVFSKLHAKRLQKNRRVFRKTLRLRKSYRSIPDVAVKKESIAANTDWDRQEKNRSSSLRVGLHCVTQTVTMFKETNTKRVLYNSIPRASEVRMLCCGTSATLSIPRELPHKRAHRLFGTLTVNENNEEITHQSWILPTSRGRWGKPETKARINTSMILNVFININQ